MRRLRSRAREGMCAESNVGVEGEDGEEEDEGESGGRGDVVPGAGMVVVRRSLAGGERTSSSMHSARSCDKAQSDQHGRGGAVQRPSERANTHRLRQPGEIAVPPGDINVLGPLSPRANDKLLVLLTPHPPLDDRHPH